MDVLFLIGRVLFSILFLTSAFNHFRHLEGMAQYADSKGVPMPKLAVGGTGALLLLGSLSVLFGIYPTIGLILLLAFLVPTSFVMHDFWAMDDPQRKQTESVNFQKNLALTGACLMFLLLEAWPIAVVSLQS